MEPRDPIFSEYRENEEAAIRTRRWKFIHASGRRARQDGWSSGSSALMLEHFRKTHLEAAQEPSRLSRCEGIDWYPRPRDA